jgi:hypothetical protein
MFIVDLFKSQRRLEAENLFLRHQLSIALRGAPPRLWLRGSDRALLVLMTRLWPNLLSATQIVQPETISSMAPRRLQGVLALEVREWGGAAKGRSWPE